MNPLISVVVTTYNQAPYIEQTLKSVFDQTYKPYEVIVVDDGSTDDTLSQITPFGDRVIYIRQKNQGIAGARNIGILKAKGEFIAFLDGDDLWSPDKLSAQVEAARTNPNSGLIAVDGVEFDENGIIKSSLLGTPYWVSLPNDRVYTGRYYQQLLECCFIFTTSQIMVPSKVFETVGLSDKRFKRTSDYDLYFRISAKFDFTIIKKQLTWWRYLKKSASGPRNVRSISYLAEEIAVLKKQLRHEHGKNRQVLLQKIESKIANGAQELYYYGRGKDRLFATRILLRLLAGTPNFPVTVIFLAGLWCPNFVTSKFGRTVRRMLLSNGNQ